MGLLLAKMAASLRLGFRRFVVRNDLRLVAALHSSVRIYAAADKMTHTGQVVRVVKKSVEHMSNTMSFKKLELEKSFSLC